MDLKEKVPEKWVPAVEALEKLIMQETFGDTYVPPNVHCSIQGVLYFSYDVNEKIPACKIHEIHIGNRPAARRNAECLGLLKAAEGVVEMFFVEPFLPPGNSTAIDGRAAAIWRFKRLFHTPSADCMLTTFKHLVVAYDDSPNDTIKKVFDDVHVGAKMTSLGAVIRGYLEMDKHRR